MNREEIEKRIKEKIHMIENLKEDIVGLKIQGYLLCDENQHYTEQEEERIISKRPKKVEKIKVGRINFKQTFYDEDTGEPCVIDRSEVVRVDGVWII